jgi:hypothetical protein
MPEVTITLVLLPGMTVQQYTAVQLERRAAYEQVAERARRDPDARRRDVALEKLLATPRPLLGWGSADARDGGRLYTIARAAYEEALSYPAFTEGWVEGFEIPLGRTADRVRLIEVSTGPVVLQTRARTRGGAQRVGYSLRIPGDLHRATATPWQRFTEARCYADAAADAEELERLLRETRAYFAPVEWPPWVPPLTVVIFRRACRTPRRMA